MSVPMMDTDRRTLTGTFDLRDFSDQFRQQLVRRVQTICGVRSKHINMLHADEHGFIVLPKPDQGPNLSWVTETEACHEAMEGALGRPIDALAHVDRMYGLDFKRFEQAHWNHLYHVFTELPEWVSDKPHPHWYGHSEGGHPVHLIGHRSQDGLHLLGQLLSIDLLLWDRRFQETARGLPVLGLP